MLIIFKLYFISIFRGFNPINLRNYKFFVTFLRHIVLWYFCFYLCRNLLLAYIRCVPSCVLIFWRLKSLRLKHYRLIIFPLIVCVKFMRGGVGSMLVMMTNFTDNKWCQRFYNRCWQFYELQNVWVLRERVLWERVLRVLFNFIGYFNNV